MQAQIGAQCFMILWLGLGRFSGSSCSFGICSVEDELLGIDGSLVHGTRVMLGISPAHGGFRLGGNPFVDDRNWSLNPCWVAVMELNLNHYNKETLSFTIYAQLHRERFGVWDLGLGFRVLTWG